MNGPIEPWGDQNTHIPPKLFNCKNKNNKAKDQSLKRFIKTQSTLTNKIKTEQSESDVAKVAKVAKQNEQRIFTLEFINRKYINTNLRKILCSQAREDTIPAARTNTTNTKKGMEIGSLKKKIVDFDIKPGNLLLVSKALQKRLCSEPRLDDLKHQIHQKIKSNGHSLLVTRARLDRKPQKKIEQSLFFRTIANINKERSKLGEPFISKLDDEMQQERKLFLRKNRKHRSWQTLSKRNYSLNSTRSIAHKYNFLD